MAIHEENLDDIIASLIDAPSGQINSPQNDDNPQTSGITLTSRAAAQVKSIIKEENLSTDLFLRIAVEGGGCSGLSYKLGLDYKTDSDKVFHSNDVEIVVDAKHLLYLDGIEIDYPDGLDARGFVFNNPNASENCGCGSSFAV